MSITDEAWVETYRPETLDDVIGHENVVDMMESFLDDSECPNILFAGPQGIGKTAIITAFAKEKYGDNWRSNVLELNASDDRGIDVVRENIKNFAVQGTAGGEDFKIIFLDEADQLTNDAQTALRRVMEDYSDTTRFFMSCNYVNQIIDPIQSRCAPLRMSRLEDEEIETVIGRVVDGEDIDASDAQVSALAREARGDARAAIQLLQTAHDDGEINDDWVEVVTGTIDDDKIEEIVDMAIGGELDEAMETLTVDIIKDGVDSRTIANSFYRVIKRKDDLPADARVKMLHKLADKEYRTKQGANPHVQWSSFVADINVSRHLSLEKYARAQQEN